MFRERIQKDIRKRLLYYCHNLYIHTFLVVAEAVAVAVAAVVVVVAVVIIAAIMLSHIRKEFSRR